MNRLTVPRCRLARTAAGLFITLARQFWNWLPDEHSEVLMALVFLENNSFQPIQCDQRIKGFVTTIHALYISYVLHIYLCMCVRRCLAVSLHCVNFAASAISSRRPSSSRLSLLWFSAGWTTVTIDWLVYQSTSSVDFSSLSPERSVVAITSLTLSRQSSLAIRVSELIVFKVQTYRALHGDALQYLQQFICTPTSLLGTDSGCVWAYHGWARQSANLYGGVGQRPHVTGSMAEH